MSCLKAFVVLTLVKMVLSTTYFSPACCDEWDGDCGRIVVQGICDGGIGSIGSHAAYCKWDASSSTCKNKDCGDYTSNCNGKHGSGSFTVICKEEGSSCVNSTGACSEWSVSKCNYTEDATSGATCVDDNAACKQATCADFKSDSIACNSETSIGGNGHCKMSGTDCVAATGCADYSAALSGYCTSHGFSGTDCRLDTDGTTCINDVCSSYKTEPLCDGDGSCYWSGGTCADFTSCSQTTNTTKCTYAIVGGTKCLVDGSACKGATQCSELTTSTSCRRYSALSCYWGTSGPCVSYTCGEFENSDASCSLHSCQPLNSCPAGGDSSSVVLVPALAVALLLSLFW